VADAVAELAALIGEDRVILADSVAQRSTSYWNSAPMQAKAILTPRSTDEVAKILCWCNENMQTVVTQGGLTNCVSAVEPDSDDIVVSLEKMNEVIEIDQVGGTATVEGGAILQTVQERIAEGGLYFPLDLGARGSCTIGGNVATNAGGINVLRYGMMRNLVLGLEAVLADGTIVSSMNRMMKNNAGYDVKQLFIGTEGTLGLVTKVVLRLFPQPASRQTALVATNDLNKVIALLHRLQSDLAGTLSAFEVMWGDYYRVVTEEGGHRAPLSREYKFYVVIQADGGEQLADAERSESVLSGALEEDLILDAVIAKSDADSADIWRIREDFEACLTPSPSYLYDVSLPLRDMEEYGEAVVRGVSEQWPDGRCYIMGHMADGNLHLFVQPYIAGDNHDRSNEIVYEPLRRIGGSVSAEHGIGVEKLAWLPLCRTPAEISLMKLMKESLDPNNILNRGRVLPD
jgi:FAD/FMN-containing dehydrogenase